MKKFFTIAALVAVSSTVTFAQRVAGDKAAGKTIPNTMNMNKADTTLIFPQGIANPTAGCDSLAVYTVQNNGGYVTGFNSYGDLEKASVFAGSGSVIGIIAQVAGVGYNTGFESTEFNAKVYSVNLTDSTFNLLGTSVGIAANAIDDSTGAPTIWPFASPVSVSGNFAASVVVGNYGTTSINAGIVIFSNNDGCGDGTKTWELWEDNSWNPFDQAWGLDIDLALGVAVTGFASNPESDLITGTSLYPNPVSDAFNLAYTNKVSGNVNIAIIDAAGRTVKMVNEGNKAAGTYVSTIDTDGMASGLYVYRITVGGKQAQGKFMVK